MNDYQISKPKCPKKPWMRNFVSWCKWVDFDFILWYIAIGIIGTLLGGMFFGMGLSCDYLGLSITGIIFLSLVPLLFVISLIWYLFNVVVPYYRGEFDKEKRYQYKNEIKEYVCQMIQYNTYKQTSDILKVNDEIHKLEIEQFDYYIERLQIAGVDELE